MNTFKFDQEIYNDALRTLAVQLIAMAEEDAREVLEETTRQEISEILDHSLDGYVADTSVDLKHQVAAIRKLYWI